MKPTASITHHFVDAIPDHLEDGALYVSIRNATVVHTCCCGCGNEVVTPLGPTDWRMTFDGETVSLAPSVGNWGFECRSHYWIDRGRVRWSLPWTDAQVERGRRADRATKQQYFDGADGSVPTARRRSRIWRRLRRLLRQ